MRDVLKNALATLRTVDWIVSLAEFVRKYIWLELGGVTLGGVIWFRTLLVNEWPLFVGLAVVAGCFFMAWRTRKKERAEERENALFDMPIREAIGHLEETVPHSFDRSGPAERVAFKQIHKRMCSGDLPVIGSTEAFGPPQVIPPAKCGDLMPEEWSVPANPSAPQGVRFCLTQYVDPKWEEGWDGVTQPQVVVQYTDLRVRSVDLYSLWPRAGVFL